MSQHKLRTYRFQPYDLQKRYEQIDEPTQSSAILPPNTNSFSRIISEVTLTAVANLSCTMQRFC